MLASQNSMQKKDNKVGNKTACKEKRQRKIKRERERKIQIDSQKKNKSKFWLVYTCKKLKSCKITSDYLQNSF